MSTEQENEDAIPFSFCVPFTLYTKCIVGIECTLAVSALIVSSIALMKLFSNKQTMILFRILGGTSIILFTISAVFHFGVVIVTITPSLCVSEIAIHFCGQTATIGYTIGMILLFTLFYCRLNMVFQPTSYSLSPLCFRLFFVASFLLVIPIPITLYYYIIWNVNATLVFGIWQLSYVVMSLILSVLFVFKAISFIKYDIDKHQQHVQLFMSVIKYSVLSLIAFSSSALGMILFFYRWRVYDSWELWLLSGASVMVDNLMNIICLFFQFPFASKYYDKYCCFVHRICSICGLYEYNGGHDTMDQTETTEFSTLTTTISDITPLPINLDQTHSIPEHSTITKYQTVHSKTRRSEIQHLKTEQ